MADVKEIERIIDDYSTKRENLKGRREELEKKNKHTAATYTMGGESIFDYCIARLKELVD